MFCLFSGPTDKAARRIADAMEFRRAEDVFPLADEAHRGAFSRDSL